MDTKMPIMMRNGNMGVMIVMVCFFSMVALILDTSGEVKKVDPASLEAANSQIMLLEDEMKNLHTSYNIKIAALNIKINDLVACDEVVSTDTVTDVENAFDGQIGTGY